MDCGVSRKVETEIAGQSSVFSLVGVVRKRIKGLKGLSVADQTSREFADRCGFSMHPDLLLAGSRELFNGSRCQCGRLRSAETDARKRSPAGRYLLAKLHTLPRRHP
jgi:hypothetical protein